MCFGSIFAGNCPDILEDSPRLVPDWHRSQHHFTTTGSLLPPSLALEDLQSFQPVLACSTALRLLPTNQQGLFDNTSEDAN